MIQTINTKPKYEPYTFRRQSNFTIFFYGGRAVLEITNIADNVAEAITYQLNIAFESGVDMGMNSALKSIEKKFTPKQ